MLQQLYTEMGNQTALWQRVMGMHTSDLEHIQHRRLRVILSYIYLEVVQLPNLSIAVKPLLDIHFFSKGHYRK